MLFDLWETLLNDPPERSRARQLARATKVQQSLQTFEIEVSLETIDEALLRVLTSLTRMQFEGRDVDPAGRVALLTEAMGTLPLPPAGLQSLEDAVCGIEPNHYPQLAPHALETLRQVRSLGLRTGLICNAGYTTSPTLRRMLDHYRLTPHLETLAFSDELRLAKPATAMFRHALRSLDVEATDAAFIGDSPHSDVFGARSAGLALAVQIGRRQQEGIEPDAYIDDLSELTGVLERHGLLYQPVDRS